MFRDDPLIALGGNEAQRTRVLAVIVVLWMALGYRLSWKKGIRGRKVSWIGAQLSDWKSHGGAPGVTVTIAPEKIHKIKIDCQRLLHADPLYAHDLRKFTGLVTWVSGILPMISVYTSMLWAALAAATRPVIEKTGVERPLKWLWYLSENHLTDVECLLHTTP